MGWARSQGVASVARARTDLRRGGPADSTASRGGALIVDERTRAKTRLTAPGTNSFEFKQGAKGLLGITCWTSPETPIRTTNPPDACTALAHRARDGQENFAPRKQTMSGAAPAGERPEKNRCETHPLRARPHRLCGCFRTGTPRGETAPGSAAWQVGRPSLNVDTRGAVLRPLRMVCCPESAIDPQRNCRPLDLNAGRVGSVA